MKERVCVSIGCAGGAAQAEAEDPEEPWLRSKLSEQEAPAASRSRVHKSQPAERASTHEDRAVEAHAGARSVQAALRDDEIAATESPEPSAPEPAAAAAAATPSAPTVTATTAAATPSALGQPGGVPVTQTAKGWHLLELGGCAPMPCDACSFIMELKYIFWRRGVAR